MDSLTGEEKELAGSALTEAGDAFVSKEIAKTIKLLHGDDSAEAIDCRQKLEQVSHLLQSEKNLKAKIKKLSARLHAQTKDAIEQLTDDQATDLLKNKWIDPLIANLLAMPGAIVDSLAASISALQDKYATTLVDVEQQIAQAESDLAAMIDQLTGSEFDQKGLSQFKALLTGDRDA